MDTNGGFCKPTRPIKSKRSYKKWFYVGNVSVTSQLRQLLVRNVVASTWPMRCRGPSLIDHKLFECSSSIFLAIKKLIRMMFSKTQIGKMFGFKWIQQHDISFPCVFVCFRQSLSWKLLTIEHLFSVLRQNSFNFPPASRFCRHCGRKRDQAPGEANRNP